MDRRVRFQSPDRRASSSPEDDLLDFFTPRTTVAAPSAAFESYKAYTDYFYDPETSQLEVAPDYPIMDPVPSNMNDLTFLNDSLSGTAFIHIINPESEDFFIPNLQYRLLSDKSSVLASSFEKQKDTEQLTIYFPQTPVIALVRWMYLDDYTLCEAMMYRPIPLLLHIQVLHLSKKYRMPDLTNQAWRHVTQALSEVTDSKTVNEIDVSESVRFVYTEMRASLELRQLLSKYCVANFRSLNGELFRQTAFQSPAFHRDLQHANLIDDFSSQDAGEITRLPVCESLVHQEDLPTWKGGNDFTCQFHALEPTKYRVYRTRFPAQSTSAFTPASQVTARIFNQSTQSRPPGAEPNTSAGWTAKPIPKLSQTSASSSGFEAASGATQKLVLRTEKQWLPAEERAMNESHSHRLPFRPAPLRSPEIDNVEFPKTCIDSSPEEAAKQSLWELFYEASTNSKESSDSPSSPKKIKAEHGNEDDIDSEHPALRSLKQTEHRIPTTDESSDSEWTNIDNPTPGQISENEGYIVVSDSEWSDVEYSSHS